MADDLDEDEEGGASDLESEGEDNTMDVVSLLE